MSDNHYYDPTSCGLSREQVFSVAADAADIFDYEPGSALMPIIGKLGGEVHFVSDGTINETQDGSILVDDEDEFKIFLADDVGLSRQRFTIAHELGHFVLHYLMADEKKPIKAHRYGSGRTEWEANWFATGFLMPEEVFRNAHRVCDGYLTDIADRLGVSYSAASHRAEQLELDVW